MRHPSTPPPRQAPLWRGDTFPVGLFGARYAGGRHPMELAKPSREERRHAKQQQWLDSDGRWRLRVATAEANRYRRPA